MACGSFSTFELSTDLHGFGDQSGHKVDTPAPTFTGVTGPAVLFYAGGSVNYRLPQVANADAAYNVSYSVTPALPTGYSLNASTGTITGSYGSALAQQNYTLRATDGFNRTADLTFSLEVSADAGIESISITSNPGADKTYGKVAPFGTNDTITVRVDFTHRLTTVLGSRVCLNIRIGSNTRQVCNPSSYTSDSSRWDKLDFSYAVQASDWDGDGISFRTNPMGAGKDGGLRFRITGVGTDNRVNRSFASIPDDANHKVRGQQTVPSFGSTASPAYSWVKGNAVSQALPAATGGDGGVTYSIEESLPAGLSFAAATRTISGTPTAAQAAANYTLAATDADGDKVTLRFSLEIEEITVSIDSPSVAEGATGATATLEYAVTLNRAPGRQVTVAYAAAADPGTATSGTDYTAITGGTLTFAAAATSQTFDVTVTGDALDEPNETVRIALSNPSGAILGSAATGVGTITDDDPTPTLALALSDPDPGNPDTINESGTGNATTVTASLSGGTSGEAITVTVTATGATAAAGDFSLSSDKTLTIAAGATTSSGTVTVTAVDDATDEPAETATVGGTLAGGHGLVDGARGPDPDHRRRRSRADALHRLAERDGGRQRLEELDLHGNPERRLRTPGDGAVCGRGHGDGHFRDGLHGHHRRHADLRGGDDEPNLQRVRDGRRSGRGGRDGESAAEGSGERGCLGRRRHRDDHRRRRDADAVDQLAERDGGRQRLRGADVHGDPERRLRTPGDGAVCGRGHGHGHFRDGTTRRSPPAL